GYSDAPLETNIKWRPLVLVIGNYSSGKSTLINEFLGGNIQTTGQAPTDDSFTVITYDDSVPEQKPSHTTEERDGKFLLNDPDYPFESLKKHGQRFASHFRLKKVNSPFLKHLAIIDTPGMHDSISEQDRGYNYQQVIGDLAEIADLILVLFDPHKAGTVQEAHTSLRDTLPSKTFEDRVLFVLNRIDECTTLMDLLRVYGTLCWNLSQMTGRKDIPLVRLTYSPHATKQSVKPSGEQLAYLQFLENQREELKEAILKAPQYRLDHLATFVEVHAERLAHFLEALITARKKHILYKTKSIFMGMMFSLIGGGAIGLGLILAQLIPVDHIVLPSVAGGSAVLLFFAWLSSGQKMFMKKHLDRTLNSIDNLTPLDSQTRRDSWHAIREIVRRFLQRTKNRSSLWDMQADYGMVQNISEHGAKDIREALNELSTIRNNMSIDPKASLLKKEDEFVDIYPLGRNIFTGAPIDFT
ncbi:MAG: dynamin family protein, partial [Candidatus Magnetomorum sp.]|nr:dynamin family protein [Candidatus Magnetomorum sp.]